MQTDAAARSLQARRADVAGLAALPATTARVRIAGRQVENQTGESNLPSEKEVKNEEDYPR